MLNITLDLDSLEPDTTQQKEAPRETPPTSDRRRPPNPMIDVGEPTTTPSQTGAAQLSATMQWGLDAERALLCILWGQPHHLGLVLRELEPAVHFSLLAHRFVLEAIRIAYMVVGDVDWDTVIKAIHDLPGAFAECGGLPGLNSIYTNQMHYPPRDRDLKPFVTEYIRFLKAVAIQRGVDPTQPVLRYTDARGILQRNKRATDPKHPCVTGTISVAAPGTYSLAGWLRGEDQITIKGQLERSYA